MIACHASQPRTDSKKRRRRPFPEATAVATKTRQHSERGAHPRAVDERDEYDRGKMSFLPPGRDKTERIGRIRQKGQYPPFTIIGLTLCQPRELRTPV